jgi:hypothetical protein
MARRRLTRGPVLLSARVTGVSDATAWRRRGKPAFLAKVAELRSELNSKAGDA